MTAYQTREAKRLGLDRAIDTARNDRYQQAMRAVRAENVRRTGAAS